MKRPPLYFRIFLFLGAVALLTFAQACARKLPSAFPSEQAGRTHTKPKRPLAVERGKIFTQGDRKMLYGGENADWHFDITNYSLKDSQLHYGIGRERFHALIEPEYISRAEAAMIYPDSARFLLLHLGNTVKAYGIDLMTHHEIVNDVVDSKPIMAAFCVLADLGAIYDRTLDDGRVYTYALSGYTYYDPQVWDGMDGFVFWDRETESLWWPLIGESVSGQMKGSQMKVLDEAYWSQTTWKKIKEQYDEVEVLKPGQTMEPPADWPRYEPEGQATSKNKDQAVAPRWGENGELKK